MGDTVPMGEEERKVLSLQLRAFLGLRRDGRHMLFLGSSLHSLKVRTDVWGDRAFK